MPPVLSIKTAVAKPIHRNEPTRLRVNLFSPVPAATRLRRQAMPGRRARDAGKAEGYRAPARGAVENATFVADRVGNHRAVSQFEERAVWIKCWGSSTTGLRRETAS